ncbi:ubiquitin carboxyl-terminal hydrolase [Myxozyma melibiosi]|uniref:Ubiquitin carboxyl-terminal hydrolase n=1 Tax=Myxozyma melibiosi TaxID=54550 RepID=A0ABR1FFP0_9ASCO
MVSPFIPLESNPDVLNRLASSLGLASPVSFHDVYSLDDESLLSFIPRPALALLLVFPISAAYEAYKDSEDAARPVYEPSPDDGVIWLKQTIGNACGTYAVLHALLNAPSLTFTPSSLLATYKHDLPPLSLPARTAYIESSTALRTQHAAVASDGETAAPAAEDDTNLHFVAFVKTQDGVLYELDGRRKGPIERARLAEDEDVLSEKATGFVKLFMEREASAAKEEEGSGSYLQFSLVALAPSFD